VKQDFLSVYSAAISAANQNDSISFFDRARFRRRFVFQVHLFLGWHTWSEAPAWSLSCLQQSCEIFPQRALMASFSTLDFLAERTWLASRTLSFFFRNVHLLEKRLIDPISLSVYRSLWFFLCSLLHSTSESTMLILKVTFSAFLRLTVTFRVFIII